MESNKKIKVKFNRLEKDPMNFVDEEDILSNLELIVDNYRIEDWGSPLEINYEVINNAK